MVHRSRHVLVQVVVLVAVALRSTARTVLAFHKFTDPKISLASESNRNTSVIRELHRFRGGSGDSRKESEATNTNIDDAEHLANEGRNTGKIGVDHPLNEERNIEIDETDHRAADTPDPVPQMQHSSPLPNESSRDLEKRLRHTSDVISHILTDRNDVGVESFELRQLISNRAEQYKKDLQLCGPGDKLPHPKKLLHYIAPKVPAIKHSPDFMLRVQASRADIDAGIAACAIGAVALACELYDKQKVRVGGLKKDEDAVSAGSSIANDRRFEQLVECVLCGFDLKRRTLEAQTLGENDGRTTDSEIRDIEKVLDEEGAKLDEGLSVQDACRAAWGIAILAGYNTELIAGEKVTEILSALSLRTRERLLARLQLLRQGATREEDEGDDGNSRLMISQMLKRDEELLAQEAASAMWAFACVKACTGVRSVTLLETCCSILCQNPTELREKAQAECVGFDDVSSFEIDDVVERLERSEVADSFAARNHSRTSDFEDAAVPTDASKDSLLDWLSPHEVVDVLWALALHGNIEAKSRAELGLSETASAFREISFDRLVGWLRRDLITIQRIRLNKISLDRAEEMAISESPVPTEVITTSNDEGEVMVEVVDAAALLSAQVDVVEAAAESIKLEGGQTECNSVQVVDAAALLASSSAHKTDEIKTEFIETSVPVTDIMLQKGMVTDVLEKEQSAEKDDTLEENSHAKNDAEMAALLKSKQLTFTPHDLCSVAWAVTDLRDPLRFLIVDLVAQMIASLGKESASELTGGDLSNLAWAISRSSNREDASRLDEVSESPSVLVTRWIAEITLKNLGLDSEGPVATNYSQAMSSLLNHFQPPELGRLMWSLAFTMDNVADPFDDGRDGALRRLAGLALRTAGVNVEIFGAEDLVRICWAFLQLSDAKDSLSQPAQLGRIMSVIESSLLLWEGGQHERSDGEDGERPDDSIRFSTFFGKSRFSLPILNQRIGNYDVEEGEIQPYPLSKRDSLPLLRDLSVDPASLCKLAAGCAELGRKCPDFKGGWTFVRVAVRLLSSKNGQLMKQCSTRDMIRLCYACAINETRGHGREHVTRLFARRVVQFLNDAFDKTSDDYVVASNRLSLSSPWERAILLWSLGELGVRHFAADENRGSAYRKLHFVSEEPIMTDEELAALSAEATALLLHGALAMNMLVSSPIFVRDILKNLEPKIPLLMHGGELCEVAESLSHVLNSIGATDRTRTGISPDVDQKIEGVVNKQDSDTEEEAVLDKLLTESDIHKSCCRLLTALADRASHETVKFSAKEMRRLMLIYAVIPFQADQFVDSIENEVNRRMDALVFANRDGSIQGVTRLVSNSVREVSNSLSGKVEGDSPVAAFKNGLKALFRPSDADGDAPEEVAEMLMKLDRAVSLSQGATDRLERIERGTRIDAEGIIRGKEQGASVELGRCRELIASYRRVDFTTGARTSRYEQERRNDIGKRVLSRLFPPEL